MDDPPSETRTGNGTFPIRGEILDPDGSPAPGKTAWLFEEGRTVGPNGEEPIYNKRDVAISGEDGKIVFEGLPNGRYSLLVADDALGAYWQAELNDSAMTCSLRLKPNGTLSGSKPGEFLDRSEPVYGRVDEINRAVMVAQDGSFKFTDLPEGTYHLSFNFSLESINYKEQPLKVEIGAQHETNLGDSLFHPWKATLNFDFADPEKENAIEFGLLCTDSTLGRERCAQLGRDEMREGISIQRFPLGTSVPVEFTAFDSLGAELGGGGKEWTRREDSILTLQIR
jgi:hypothetical protein